MNFIFSFYFLSVLMLALAFISLFVGVTDISFFSLINGINQDVFIISRIPRTISIIIAGASLSICGLIMQQLTQNKFVSPTTAGTMDCVKLGILFTMIFFGTASFLNQVIISSIFAILGSFIFLQIIRKIRLKDIIFVPLIGLMFGGIINSITTFFAYQLNLIQNVQIWLQGNFSNVMQGSYELIYISLPLLVLAYIYANKITIAGMGEDIALNLGVSYRFILNLGLIIVAIITSIIVLTVGVLPFLGLIIPNIVSIYRGDNIRKNIINIALLGAVFLLVCDIFSRLVIYPFEIPIGLTVGVIGSFVFILLLLRKKEYA